MTPGRSAPASASARASDVAEPGDAAPPQPARASGGGSGDDVDSAAAVVETLKALGRDSIAARIRMRIARAIELDERAVATAVAKLPSSATLILAAQHHRVVSTRRMAAGCAGGSTPGSAEFRAAVLAAWAGADTQLLVHSKKCAELLHARSHAGTLWTLTREEQLYFGARGAWQVAYALLEAVGDALTLLPPPSTPAGYRLLARDCCVAMRAVLQLDAAGQLMPEQLLSSIVPDLFVNPQAVRQGMADMLNLLLRDSPRMPISLLRLECGLTPEEEEAMKGLLARLEVSRASAESIASRTEKAAQLLQQLASEDLARNGLRACALPSCAAVEPHPRAFKVCARCRSCVYCGAEHQRADWSRHKRVDGCKAPQ